MWSLIKDQVLSSYMPVYINKVKERGKHIVLIDGYARPGVFDDQSAGSPMIICSSAEKYAKGRYDAYFFNIKQSFHLRLESVLQRAGWSHSAHCYLGDSSKYISQIPQALNDDTVFLYLDPFGLKGCSFHQLEPFLRRNPNYSTEIILTMCMPVVHRLAAFHAVKRGDVDSQIESYHQLLTLVFGGDYWQDILFREDINAETKEYQLINVYLQKLRAFLPYVGCCPVRKKSDERIKYFIVFVSGHSDAMLLMNDFMYNAYFSNMHKADYGDTLFRDSDWKDMPLPEENSLGKLKSIIIVLFNNIPGKQESLSGFR